jgi:hypothetical protein
MKTEEMICELRRLEEAHKDDFAGTGETNWSLMCYDVANRLEELLKAQEPSVAYWIPCNGKSHIWYCSECGEKINYNDARRTYKTEKKPVEAVNRYCRGCGATMVQRPTDEQREAVKWE